MRHSLTAHQAAQPQIKDDKKSLLHMAQPRTKGGTRLTFRRASFALLLSVLLLLAAPLFHSVNAHDGEDHGKDKNAGTPVSSTSKTSVVPVRTAERNVGTPAGSFRVRLRQSPADPRTGEEVQFEAEVLEQIEGGFGAGGGLQPVEGATVTARVMTAAGSTVETNLETHRENRPGTYGVHYVFGDAGNFKLVFDARTPDNREVSIDFPVAVVRAPVNWIFWLGCGVLASISIGAVAISYTRQRGSVSGRTAARQIIPVAAAAAVFFACGVIALAYFAPPRERREVAAMPAAADTAAIGTTPAAGDTALGGAGAIITIPKESQLLFSIRTEPIAEREIVSGLKTTGVVRAKPDARAVVSPPVSGRLTLNRNITIGAAIGRGQTIGSIEQVLGATEQAELESRRIELRTAALEGQARASEQQSLAGAARTRLAQARRELQRATNLLAVDAAPRKRVEEAQTAVRLAEGEVAAAEAQARIAGQGAKLAQDSVARVEPKRTFPLVAPVTGLVANLRVANGQQVEAGTELLSLINLTTVSLEAQVFEGDLSAVRESGRATYTAPSMGGEVYHIGEGGDGRLASIGQSVDPQTRAVPVFFEVPNPLNRLREGMFVEITLDTSGRARVLTVPKQSVINEGGRTFVFVFMGGETYEKRVVTLGAEGQDYYEARSGVRAGERVVTEGIYQLRSTQPGA